MAIAWGAVLSGMEIMRKIAEKYQDPKFNEAYLSLQSKIMEIQEDHIRLTNENEGLKKTQDLSSKVSFKRPYIYLEGDSEPYCQKCYENEGKLVHVGQKDEWDMGQVGRICPVCEHIGHEKWRD